MSLRYRADEIYSKLKLSKSFILPRVPDGATQGDAKASPFLAGWYSVLEAKKWVRQRGQVQESAMVKFLESPRSLEGHCHRLLKTRFSGQIVFLLDRGTQGAPRHFTTGSGHVSPEMSFPAKKRRQAKWREKLALYPIGLRSPIPSHPHPTQ